jgi:hypothetical protein
VGDDPRPTLTAFVGGLDLTDGRYDTPDHPLFSSLNTMHKAQIRQKSAKQKNYVTTTFIVFVILPYCLR